MIFFLEEFETLRERKTDRVKSAVFYWVGVACLGVGIYLISKEILLGAGLILTAFPFFMLYPLVRFLLGGKDSLLSVVGTAVVEEFIKHEITKKIDKKRKW